MLDIKSISKLLRKQLDDKRFQHSMGVKKKAEELAYIYDVSVKKAGIAGLLHDCAKNYNNSQLLNLALEYKIKVDNVTKNSLYLLHGEVGSKIAHDYYGVKDSEILNAIRFHTTGREDMTDLEKIIFISDFIEPNRVFPGVDRIRKEALLNLDMATLMGLDHTISYVIKKGNLLHPSTINARNFILMQINSKSHLY